jgi:hypothetical protein
MKFGGVIPPQSISSFNGDQWLASLPPPRSATLLPEKEALICGIGGLLGPRGNRSAMNKRKFSYPWREWNTTSLVIELCQSHA